MPLLGPTVSFLGVWSGNLSAKRAGIWLQGVSVLTGAANRLRARMSRWVLSAAGPSSPTETRRTAFKLCLLWPLSISSIVLTRNRCLLVGLGLRTGLGDFWCQIKYRTAVLAKLGGVVERVCPLCGAKGRFRAFGHPPRYDAECPGCSSLERHRLLYLAIESERALWPEAEYCTLRRSWRSTPTYDRGWRGT
jgi:hypothetical protein